MLLARELDLVSGALVAIDGAFFHGDASKGSIATRKKLTEQIAALDRDIEAYGVALDANDATEAEHSPGGGGGGDVAQKVATVMAKRARAQAELDRLEASGETQLSRTDADARLLTKNGQTVAGYNVQVAIDDKDKLIVASEVVNDGNDTGQLYKMAKAAKEALGAETLQAVADGGYYNGATLKACEDDGIVAYVPQAKRTGRLQAQSRFSHEDFTYEAAADAYRCPAGSLLLPTQGRKKNTGDRIEIRYMSRKATCNACPLRGRCVTDKTPTRTVYRWEHEDVIERHRIRMKDAGALMRRRAGLAEHPFGTLKCRAGYRHFLVRGFNKVRGEWSLMALCYNFARAQHHRLRWLYRPLGQANGRRRRSIASEHRSCPAPRQNLSDSPLRENLAPKSAIAWSSLHSSPIKRHSCPVSSAQPTLLVNHQEPSEPVGSPAADRPSSAAASGWAAQRTASDRAPHR